MTSLDENTKTCRRLRLPPAHSVGYSRRKRRGRSLTCLPSCLVQLSCSG